ncbi:tyrosine-type recombinase/integrase [Nocardiopsis dassonvillei]|uniref:tyrosine-type recombinase/integrase n=1 Tax=Nocardiopsis dassonvillei TaxID=2014 RepID=UPI003557A7B5
MRCAHHPEGKRRPVSTVREGSTFKRCTCRHPDTRTPVGARCPKLRRRNGTWSSTHGRWGYQIELPPTAEGKRRQARKVGLACQEDALGELAHIKILLETAHADEPETLVRVADLIQTALRAHTPLPDVEEVKRRINLGVDVRTTVPTVEEWLTEWLKGKPGLAEGTRASYAGHLRNHLIPHLGQLPLNKLQARHVEAMFATIEENNEHVLECRESSDPQVRAQVKGKRITSLSTKHRIRATLRSALSDAVRSPELPITVNVASHARLPSCPRKKPLVWTADRVARWRKDGTVPGEVMVWTPDQTTAFLTHARKYPWLYALFHLIAIKGLRRGEAVGLPWRNVRLTDGQVDITTQIVQVGWRTITSTPKSDAGSRTITLDATTARVLKRWRRHQLEAKLAAGKDWVNSGLVFTRTNGEGWHPAEVTDWFNRIGKAADLPPIGLHGLRHGAASTALAAGVDVKVVSAELGHATTHFTQDTYQTVFPDVAKAAAEATAAMFTAKGAPTAR